jgi:hypothetical protein
MSNEHACFRCPPNPCDNAVYTSWLPNPAVKSAGRVLRGGPGMLIFSEDIYQPWLFFTGSQGFWINSEVCVVPKQTPVRRMMTG